MRLDLFIHYPEDDEPLPWMDRLSEEVGLILEGLENIMANLDELKAAVHRNTSVDDSVLAMLQGIVQQLKDAQAQNDPKAIDDLIAELDANTAKMTDAVSANTPAQPPADQPTA